MTGWSRQREDVKLSAWAKSQDLALVERELERAKKDLSRAGSVSLKPDYILKRQQERARAKDATNRLSAIGLRFDLGPFLFDQPISKSTSSSKTTTKQASVEQPEILQLQDELARLKEREKKLEYALSTSESKRHEERDIFDRDRRLMMSAIGKLKLELTYSWNRIARLKQKYEGIRFAIESEQTSPRNIYETDESFERIFRASSDKSHLARLNQSTKPSTSSLARPSYSNQDIHRSRSASKSSIPNSKSNTVSSLKTNPEKLRTRRVSLN